MQNPSFEQVTGPASAANPNYYYGGIAPAATGSVMRDTAATTGVPGWTATNIYPEPAYPRVLAVENGVFLGQTTSHGTKFALIPGFLGARPQELVGRLAPATAPGTAYVLSANVAKRGLMNPPKVQLWLRNSGTGAVSSPLVHLAGPQPIDWTRVTGSVTANVSYDQVVLRYEMAPNDSVYQGTILAGSLTWLGLADDIRVCKATGHVPAGGRWTTARVAGAAVLGVILLGFVLGVLRRFRTRGRYSSATVRG